MMTEYNINVSEYYELYQHDFTQLMHQLRQEHAPEDRPGLFAEASKCVHLYLLKHAA